MLNEHNVVLAGGQGSLAGKIFRIGHLGNTPTIEIEETLESLEKVLNELGFRKP
jgi:aspartate aminotransferase-like enzyme